MIGIGCLAPLVLAACGALLGHLVAGPTAALWGGGAGLGVGVVVLAGFAWLGQKLKS